MRVLSCSPIKIPTLKHLQYVAISHLPSPASPAFLCVMRSKTQLKKINHSISCIYENRKHFKLEKSTKSETMKITLVDSGQTSPMVDPLVVGREVEVAGSILVDRFFWRLGFAFPVVVAVGSFLRMSSFGAIGLRSFEDVPSCWIGSYDILIGSNDGSSLAVKVTFSLSRSSSAKSRKFAEPKDLVNPGFTAKRELQRILSDFVASGESFCFRFLDNVMRADVWVDLLRVPLYNSNVNVRVLVTTRYENVAKDMEAVIHPLAHLFEESSWYMPRRRLFSEAQEELANCLKEL
ncbi:hypothetical protein IEQ34_001703 [Dendrobium chrysotoxum]|uniref:Uncharacterized protein n=1 Tax=Dendrobium chrysotoxum TaxID=161865 RepID=A0AAV7H7K7_DENCH|nr:hypothetical protein IEQ34_001703 [Dendrobium chrysotoxum]